MTENKTLSRLALEGVIDAKAREATRWGLAGERRIHNDVFGPRR